MKSERVQEIIQALWLLNEAERRSLMPNKNSTDEDVLGYNYLEFVRRLRDAAEFSSYVPNAMKWSAMADDLEKFGREWDRKDA